MDALLDGKVFLLVFFACFQFLFWSGARSLDVAVEDHEAKISARVGVPPGGVDVDCVSPLPETAGRVALGYEFYIVVALLILT